MTNPDTAGETTAGGMVGKLAGKAKAAAGSLTGNDDLAREGRLQEAQSEAEITARKEEAEAQQARAEAELEAERAETKAERDELRNELTEQEREEQAERDRQAAEQQAAADAPQRP